MSQQASSTPDVLVIGGGPAGLAAAIAAAQHGFAVQVAEPCSTEIDKCCGEGLLPPAVKALARLGISAAQLAATGFPFADISFRRKQHIASSSFAVAHAAFGVRRTALCALLAARAEEAGVERIKKAAKLLSLAGRATVLVGDRVLSPRWIVAADGAGSAARRAAGLDVGQLSSSRFALRQHFRLGDADQTPARVEVHWGDGTQAYVTPVATGVVGIAMLSRHKLADMPAALAGFPALEHLVHGATACSRPRGAVSVHRTLRKVQAGPLALVGDASGSVDAITGDGLALAFQQAVFLAAALQAGHLEQYQTAHNQLLRPARIMSRTLLAMSAHPAMTRAAMMALGHVPGLFQLLLRVHTGSHLTPVAPEESVWRPAST